MTKIQTITPEFVEFIPQTLEDGVLYVSMEYTTVVHLCACGCGRKVVNPLSPAQWRLTYDGTVSLRPSVGSWDLACGSHYWIEDNRIDWSRPWSKRQIEAGRMRDRVVLEAEYGITVDRSEPADQPSFWSRMKRLLHRGS